jgi:hypothetical protein
MLRVIVVSMPLLFCAPLRELPLPPRTVPEHTKGFWSSFVEHMQRIDDE